MTGDAGFVVVVESGVACGPVRLGMPMAEVVAVLGEPEARHPLWSGDGETLFWLRSTFQVTFGVGATVVDVQLCARGPVVAVFRGIDLLSTPADEVVARLSSLGEGSYEEDGSSFSFSRARLGFWRQGLPDDWEPDEYEQYRDGLFWDTVNTWADPQGT